MRAVALPEGVLVGESQSFLVAFEVAVHKDKAAGHADVDRDGAGFAAVNGDGDVVVLAGHGVAVDFEFDGGGAFAGAFRVFKGSEAVALGDGGLVVEGAAALVDDGDGGLVGVEVQVAVDHGRSDGFAFL